MITVELFKQEQFDEVQTVFVSSWLYLCEDVLSLDVSGVDPSEINLTPTLVAIKESSIIGFVQIENKHLQKIYISPAHLGIGAGHILLKEAMKLGVNKLIVDEHNSIARSFYENNGWRWSGISEPAVRFPKLVNLIYELNTSSYTRSR